MYICSYKFNAICIIQGGVEIIDIIAHTSDRESFPGPYTRDNFVMGHVTCLDSVCKRYYHIVYRV